MCSSHYISALRDGFNSVFLIAGLTVVVLILKTRLKCGLCFKLRLFCCFLLSSKRILSHVFDDYDCWLLSSVFTSVAKAEHFSHLN